MYDDNFRKALFDALTPEYKQILDDASDTHEFSVEFEKKMQKLIKLRNKPYYKIINTVGKRVACIVVIVLIASSVTVLSVDALRNAVADFFVNIYEKFSTVQSVNEDKTAPTTIEDIYAITYDLSDYDVIYEEKDNYSYNITYIKDDVVIDFLQYTKDMYDKNVNTEGAEITTIDINNYEAVYFLDNHNYNHLIFDNGEYIIYISSNISKNALICIAESVRKVE